ncbi:MAG: phosphoglycerate dehydrogenase [Deltaproteobacteria bacterium]|nr:phosphoglycerate dehydrogenase [Deltaproteobacteria bacterium]
MKSLKGVKILIGPSSFAAMDPDPMNLLTESGCTVIDNPYKRKLTKDELVELLSENGVTGLIAGLEPLDREVFERSDLKVISRCGSGLSNVDVEAAEMLGIRVCYTPYGPTQAVAELTIGAMLNLIRMVPLMNKDLHEGKWTKEVGILLEGKTVLIIGFGRIGRRVAELLTPFKVRILAVDEINQEAFGNVAFVSLEDALTQADILTIHASGETCILRDKEFALIKPGAFLLNAARGGLIDEGCLIDALDSGVIAGAWLDAFEHEPYRGPLEQYSQVLLTPHIGSYTVECRRNMELESVENLLNAFNEIE